MINRLKKFGFVGLFAIAMVSSSAMAFDLTETAQVKIACRNALEGKCYHGQDLERDLGFSFFEFVSSEDADRFCRTVAPPYCGVDECYARLRVVMGIIAPSTKGNPCLPTL
jgi:hypothetical protein